MSKLSLPQPGDRFGRWTVTGPTVRKLRPLGADSVSDWFTPCQCDCGCMRFVRTSALRRGKSASCGCKQAELGRQRWTTHGRYGTTENNIWNGLIQRCTNPRSSDWSRYGGRGITVCERWKSFENFFADMGPRPSPEHSLDRLDGNGNYEPGNVRWATQTEQQNNRRDNVLLTWNGETLTLSEWSRRLGKNVVTLWNRLKRGWSVERTLTEP